MNPKPFFSLNHLTVPLAIQSLERANHPGIPAKNNRHLVRLSARLEKCAIIENLRQNRQEECKGIVSSGIRLRIFGRFALSGYA
jgi:hypothetical protein